MKIGDQVWMNPTYLLMSFTTKLTPKNILNPSLLDPIIPWRAVSLYNLWPHFVISSIYTNWAQASNASSLYLYNIYYHGSFSSLNTVAHPPNSSSLEQRPTHTSPLMATLNALSAVVNDISSASVRMSTESLSCVMPADCCLWRHNCFTLFLRLCFLVTMESWKEVNFSGGTRIGLFLVLYKHEIWCFG